MGRLIVSMNLSLDGYIEGPGREDGSWVRIDEEVHRHVNRLAAGADALLYGRKVYEVMIRTGLTRPRTRASRRTRSSLAVSG